MSGATHGTCGCSAAVRLEASYDEARRITRHHAKSFSFASIALPPEKKRHAYAVYAFCRYLDDTVDRAEGDLAPVIADLRAFTERVFQGESSAEDRKVHSWLPAFLKTVEACDIPASYFFDLLAGVEMDRGSVRIRTWEELERYCYHVAGVVGLIMTRVFGLEDRTQEPRAVDMGNAMQLTNILRDVAEDYRMDRIYLPEEELARFGLDASAIAGGRNDEKWKAFMDFQIARARDLYRRAEAGIAALPDDGSRLTVWLMSDVYGGILGEIEKADRDVFSARRRVSFARKCLLGLGAWRKNRQLRA